MKPERIDPHRLVLRPAAEPTADPAACDPAAAARTLGSLQPLSGARGGWLLTLQTKQAPTAAALKALAAAGCQVLPVLLDEDGRDRYPTGELVLRFSAPVDDDELARVAQSHALRMIRRSSFTNNQAVFALRDAAHDDPVALAARLAKHPGVAAAWLDAESPYRRGR